MEFNPLSLDFNDEILSDVNTQRKYKQTVNKDGTISLQDMTAYDQEGSSYTAKHIIEERKAINDIYANRVVSLEEASLVTEPGFFCDALVINELNKKNDYDPTMQTYNNNGWNLTYRHIDHNHIYVEMENIMKGGVININGGLVMAGIPFNLEFSQTLSICMQVANVVVGYGRIKMETNHGAYLVCTNYSNDVSLVGFGILTIKS
jgi:hypothetical protein|nr:MAG TPA: hypothetical protein [Caudoviricetes sp.]